LKSSTLKTRFPKEARMPRYFFSLHDGSKIIPDPDGTELTDYHAARSHAFRVMRELSRNREEATSGWRLVVCEGRGLPCFELCFASADDTMSRYPPRCA
jgi:hypothetical protein